MAVVVKPSTETALFRAGVEAMQAGRLADARRQFDENETALGTTQSTRELLNEAARAEAAGELDLASRSFLQVLERNPAIAEAHLGLARVSLMIEQPQEALTYARAAVKLAPQLAQSWTLLGLAHEATGEVAAAFSHLEKGASLGARDYLAQYNLGRVLAATGKPAQAVPYLLTAASLEPNRLEARLALGAAQLALKQPAKAAESLELATKLSPDRPEAWSLWCDALFAQRKLAEARAVIDRALETVGEHPALFDKAVACAAAQRDFEGAVGYLERLVALVPEYEQGWMQLAQLAAAAGDGARSEAAARQLISLDPENYEPWFHLGNLYDALPDEAKAEDAYRHAVALAPENWKVLMNFGTALVQTSHAAKHAEAKTLLTKAKELAPSGEWRPHYNLALAHVRLGETAAALELVRELQRKASAEDPIAQEAKKLESNLLEKK